MTAPRTFLAALVVLLALAGASLWLFRAPSTPLPQSPVAVPPVVVPPPSDHQGRNGSANGFGGGGRPPSIVDRFAEVDAALTELVQGRIAFNAPERMRLSDSDSVALIASPDMDAGTMSSELRNRIGGADPIQTETLQIAPLMEAQLEGAPSFDVTALTPLRQPVSRSAPTEWRWTVTAAQTGRHELHLTISAIISVDGVRYPRSLHVLNRDIDVQVTARQRLGMFLGTNWQWLLGTLVIPSAAWLWSRKRKKAR